MRAESQFTVAAFTPTAVAPAFEVTTGVPVAVATMEKRYMGTVEGRSATMFTSAYDPAVAVGTYAAIESFDGSVDGASGTFNFFHSATTTAGARSSDFFVIVPGSGAGDLQGISGTGGIAVDPDGTHRLWLEYEIAVDQ